MNKKKRFMLLWVPFAAMSGWFMCFMRACFRLAVSSGLRGQENTLFAVLCAGVVLGMTVPLPDIITSWNKNKAVFRTASAAAAVFTVSALNTQGNAALIFTFAASFSASAANGCALYRISLQLEKNSFGSFFGTAFAASEALLLIFLQLPENDFPAAAAAFFLCLLPAAAVLFYKDGDAADLYASDEQEQSADIPSASVRIKYFAAMLLYCVMGGMLDNLTTFDSSFYGIPGMLSLIYLYSVAANTSVGLLFRSLNWNRLAMFGVLLICIGQALPYFSTVSALAVPYLALTMLGVIIMEFLVRSMPVRFAAGTGRSAAVPRAGYACLYGGFFTATIIFEYIPRGRYYFVMGIVLLLAFAVLFLLYAAFSEEERRRYERIMRELRKMIEENAVSVKDRSAASDIEVRMEQLGLTAREREVCALLLSAFSLKQIAADLQIAYGTANKHYTSIYRKLGISSKAELFRKFDISSS